MKKGWKLKTISQIGKVYNGNSINENFKKNNYTNLVSGFPFIATKDVGFNSFIDYNNGVKIPFSERDKFKIAPVNTALICAEGGSAGRKYAITNQEVCFGNKLFALTPYEDILSKYVFYFYQSKDFQNNFKSEVKGIIGGVSMSRFKNIAIPIPPLEEQRTIVAKLDQAFAQIDQAKANIEKNIANAKELFQSKLNQIFSQKGEGWVEKRIDEICQNFDSKRIPITKNKRIEGIYPYYGASGIVDYVSDFIFEGDYLLVSEDGANLLARTYPIAFSVNGKFWVNNHAHILKFVNSYTQKFVEYYLNSIKLDDYVSGMAQPKLNQAKLNSISVPIPFNDFDSQQKIVTQLDQLQEQTNLLVTKYQQKLANLEELKKSILEKAFKGELT